MQKYGAKRENIVIESVPGSYELPIACSRCVPLSRLLYTGPFTRKERN